MEFGVCINLQVHLRNLIAFPADLIRWGGEEKKKNNKKPNKQKRKTNKTKQKNQQEGRSVVCTPLPGSVVCQV